MADKTLGSFQERSLAQIKTSGGYIPALTRNGDNYKIPADNFNSNADLNEVKQDLSGVKQDLSGVKQDLSGVKQDLSGVKQDLNGVKQDLSGVKQDLNGVKQDLNGVKQDLNGVKQDLNGVKGNLTDVKNFIASDYDPNSGNYAKNDLSWHDGKVYRANDSTSGAWDSSKWDEVPLSSLVSVDSELSSTSERPVQNKAIYAVIGDVESLLAAL